MVNGGCIAGYILGFAGGAQGHWPTFTAGRANAAGLCLVSCNQHFLKPEPKGVSMSVVNIHERVFDASIAEIGKLIDGLASADDKLWPRDRWPAIQFDRPLSTGAVGGHGPIRYTVESYKPGSNIQFRFTEPKDFLGSHRFEVATTAEGKTRLRHILEMQVHGMARLTWPLAICPLHDALLEDVLDQVEIYTGGQPAARSWSLWVKLLRRVMRRGRSTARKQWSFTVALCFLGNAFAGTSPAL
jgi:hypothetical protein